MENPDEFRVDRQAKTHNQPHDISRAASSTMFSHASGAVTGAASQHHQPGPSPATSMVQQQPQQMSSRLNRPAPGTIHNMPRNAVGNVVSEGVSQAHHPIHPPMPTQPMKFPSPVMSGNLYQATSVPPPQYTQQQPFPQTNVSPAGLCYVCSTSSGNAAYYPHHHHLPSYSAPMNANMHVNMPMQKQQQQQQQQSKKKKHTISILDPYTGRLIFENSENSPPEGQKSCGDTTPASPAATAQLSSSECAPSASPLPAQQSTSPTNVQSEEAPVIQTVSEPAEERVSTTPQLVAEEKWYKDVQSILHKLTRQNLSKSVKQIKDMKVDTEEKLKAVVDLLYERAIDDICSSSLYALMCKQLEMVHVPLNSGKGTVNFRTLLISKCQKKFAEGGNNWLEHLEKEEDGNLMENEQQEGSEHIFRNIRLTGELFRQNMVTELAIHECIEKLLKQDDDPSLMCLCHLLANTGLLEQRYVTFKGYSQKEDPMNVYIARMQKSAVCGQRSPIARSVVEGFLNFRKLSASLWTQKTDEAERLEAAYHPHHHHLTSYSAPVNANMHVNVLARKQQQQQQSERKKNTISILDPYTGHLIFENSENAPPEGQKSCGDTALSPPATSPQLSSLESAPSASPSPAQQSTSPTNVQSEEVGVTEALIIPSVSEPEESASTAPLPVSDKVTSDNDNNHLMSENSVNDHDHGIGEGTVISTEQTADANTALPTPTQGKKSKKKKGGVKQMQKDLAKQNLRDLLQLYNSKKDQWSPLNPEGKRQYDRDFLLLLQVQPMSLKKPSNLPNLDIIKDKPQIRRLTKTSKTPLPCPPQSRSYGDFLHEPASAGPQKPGQIHRLPETSSTSLPASTLQYKDYVDMFLPQYAHRGTQWLSDVNRERIAKPKFIRGLARYVFEKVIVGSGEDCSIDPDEAKHRFPAIRWFVNGKGDLQLQTLYAAQAVANRLNHPKGLLKQIFNLLYEDDIVTEETFKKWEKSTDPVEQEGKSAALASVSSFFARFSEAEQESSSGSSS